MKTPLVLCAVLLMAVASGCQRSHPPTIYGTWAFVPEQSTDMATWRYRLPQLSIDSTEAPVRVVVSWLERSRAAFADTFLVDPGGKTLEVPITSRIWPGNWYMGVLAVENSVRKVSGAWTERPVALDLTTEQPVSVSQGDVLLTTHWEFRVDAATGRLTVREQRSSRPTPVVMTFERLED